MSTSAAPPSPIPIFETFTAFHRTAALKSAVELDLFTAIGKGHNTVKSLANIIDARERGIRILCDCLTAMGFLTKSGPEGPYALTQDTAMFLDRKSPAYLGSITEFLNAPMSVESFSQLTASVRQGGVNPGKENALDPEHPVWVDFARAMAPMMQLPAQLIANILGAPKGEKWRVLDIAAGHGVFGIALARNNPNAHITAVDWANVLRLAEQNAKNAGLTDRYALLPGSAFDVDFGTGYDVVLVTNFLHHFEIHSCENFMRKVHASLKPGGRAAILEFVPNEDRVSPTTAAMFSLIMLATTPAGDAYTYAQYEKMLKASGFARLERHSLEPTPQTLVVAHK